MRIPLTILLAFGSIAFLGGRPAAAASQPCSLHLVGGEEKCFSPGQVGAALKLFPHAVNPSPAVYRATRLTLRQVIVISAPITVTGKKGGPPHLGPFVGSSIQFVYGTMKGHTLGSGPSPKYVEVTEYATRITRFVHRYYQNGLEITPILRKNPPPYGPWFVRANFPRYTLSLTMAANFDQGTVKQLAHAILQAGG